MERSRGIVYMGKIYDELMAVCDFLELPDFKEAVMYAAKKKRHYESGRIGFYPQSYLVNVLGGLLIKKVIDHWFIVDVRNPQWNKAQITYVESQVHAPKRIQRLLLCFLLEILSFLLDPDPRGTSGVFFIAHKKI